MVLNEFCEGYVFTGVCRQGGGLSVQGRSIQGDLCPSGLCPGRGVSVRRGVSVQGRSSLYGNEWAVLILLECILVSREKLKLGWEFKNVQNQGSHSDWKTWENGKAFSSQGKVREFWWDWKSQGKSHKILENWGNFRQMLFVIFQWQLNEFVCYLVNLIKFSVKKQSLKKILDNGKKYWKSQGILSVWKSGNPENQI